MLRNNYYCFVAGLPDLLFNENRQGINSLDFRNELKQQLSKTDFELVELLYLPNDNKNLLNLLFDKNEPFNLLSNYGQEFLENEISQPYEIPDYMRYFIEWTNNIETHEFNFQTENKLHSLFYEYRLATKNSFLNEWFKLELNIKNILTAFNCVQFNYSFKKHLISVNQNNTVYSLLISKHLKPEFFDDEIPFSDKLFQIAESNKSLMEKEKAIDKIRWDYLDEQTVFHYFTIEKILSYLLKLGIIERWMKLDIETGKALLNKLIDELKLSYTFPEEFSIVK